MTREAKIGWGLSIASVTCGIVAAAALAWAKDWPTFVSAVAGAAMTGLATLASAWGLVNRAAAPTLPKA
jgi:hypothetical protein